MIGISVAVVVCATSVVAAAGGQEDVQLTSCEIFTEARPMADLRSCLHPPSRDDLGREVLERAGRQLEPDESAETTCRMLTGGGGAPAA